MTACKWPEKQRHPSKAAAKAAIGALYAAGRGNPDLSPYPCGDHWHVGHELAHFRDRIRRAMRQGRRTGTTYAKGRRTKR